MRTELTMISYFEVKNGGDNAFMGLGLSQQSHGISCPLEADVTADSLGS